MLSGVPAYAAKRSSEFPLEPYGIISWKEPQGLRSVSANWPRAAGVMAHGWSSWLALSLNLGVALSSYTCSREQILPGYLSLYYVMCMVVTEQSTLYKSVLYWRSTFLVFFFYYFLIYIYFFLLCVFVLYESFSYCAPGVEYTFRRIYASAPKIRGSHYKNTVINFWEGVTNWLCFTDHINAAHLHADIIIIIKRSFKGRPC